MRLSVCVVVIEFLIKFGEVQKKIFLMILIFKKSVFWYECDCLKEEKQRDKEYGV